MSNNIGAKLDYLEDTKERIRDAISKKLGETIPADATFRSYADYVSEIDISTATLQEKTVTPTAEDIEVVCDAEYDGLSKVTVEGDGDLIADNIKKDVTIFGVTGTFEGEGGSGEGGEGDEPNYQSKSVTATDETIIVLPDEGYDALSQVTVYPAVDSGSGSVEITGTTTSLLMTTNIMAGQRFVGQKNEGADPYLVFEGTAATVYKSSDDGSVFISFYSIYSTTTTFQFYLRKEDGTGYELINVALPTEWATACTNSNQTSFTYNNFVINEDGTLIMGGLSASTNYTPFVLVIEVNKGTRTAEAKVIVDPWGSDDRPYSKNHNLNFLVGNCVLGGISYYDNGNKTRDRIFEYSNGHFTEVADLVGSSSTWSTATEKGGYIFTFRGNSGVLQKINKNTGKLDGEVVITPRGGSSVNCSIVSSGYLAIAYGKNLSVCRINFSNLYWSEVFYVSGTAGSIYADKSGDYVYTAGGIYSMSTGQKLFDAAYSPYGGFDSKNGWLCYSTPAKSFGLARIVSSDEGEYTASACLSTAVQAGKVYGIATEDIASGEVGTGKILFVGPSA